MHPTQLPPTDFSPFRVTDQNITASQEVPPVYSCPNPACGMLLPTHASVCDHLSEPEGACTRWAMSYVLDVLNHDHDAEGTVHCDPLVFTLNFNR